MKCKLSTLEVFTPRLLLLVIWGIKLFQILNDETSLIIWFCKINSPQQLLMLS